MLQLSPVVCVCVSVCVCVTCVCVCVLSLPERVTCVMAVLCHNIPWGGDCLDVCPDHPPTATQPLYPARPSKTTRNRNPSSSRQLLHSVQHDAPVLCCAQANCAHTSQAHTFIPYLCIQVQSVVPPRPPLFCSAVLQVHVSARSRMKVERSSTSSSAACMAGLVY